jgi:nucleoside-diphosphate-sugar epimerase
MELTDPVVVMGASGLVDSALVADLASRGVRVGALMREVSRATQGADVVVVRSFDDAISLTRALDGPRAVVHLPASALVMHETISNVEAANNAVNVEGTRHLLGAARAASVP